MHPVLFTVAGVSFPTYALFVLLGFAVAMPVRRADAARLGHGAMPGYGWVPLSALLGAVVGAKLGMLLFVPWGDFRALLAGMAELDFTGKTVVGALAGGVLAVEITKRRVGITRRTGDAFAVALPLGLACGRIGCFFNGCCVGTAWDGPWAVSIAGVARHPVQLYETGLDLGLAALMASYRGRAWPEGHHFRRMLVGYAGIRLVLETLRDDAQPLLGPLTLIQLVCAATILGYGRTLYRDLKGSQ